MQNNTIFSKNISALKTHFPLLLHEIEKEDDEKCKCTVLASDKGPCTLEVCKNGKRILIHSRNDPIREARRFVASNTDGTEQAVFIYGFGLGYHIEELLLIDSELNLIIIEPSIKLFKAALNTRDITGIFKSERVLILFDIESFAYDRILSDPAICNIKLLALRPYVDLFKESFLKLRAEIHTFLNRKAINTATLKRFDRLWTKNTFKNSPCFFTLSGIQLLRDKLKGLPAIVLCAGPSLEEDINTIATFKDHIILISVDTALLPLLKRGITPDFVIAVDPQFINSLYMATPFESYKGRSDLPILVADPAVYPTTLRNYHGLKVLTSSVFSPGKVIERFSGKKGSIAAGGSVSVVAYDLARILGTDPVILMGLDLSYRSDRTHLSGSFYETYVGSRTNRCDTTQNFFLKYIRGGSPVLVQDKNGNTVITDKRLLLYKSWFENQAPFKDVKIINATMGGLNIEGIENRPFEDLIEDLSHKKVKKKRLLNELIVELKNIQVDVHRVTDFVKYLKYLHDRLPRLQKLSNEAKELVLTIPIYKDENSVKRIKNQLEEIDKSILSFKEETQLLSMVMQTSIDDVLNRGKGAFLNSQKLYSSIDEGSKFLSNLIKISLKKLKRLRSDTDKINNNAL